MATTSDPAAAPAPATAKSVFKDYLPIVTAVLSGVFIIASGFLGARLGASNTRSLQIERASLEYRMQIYRDFVSAQAKSQIARENDDKARDAEAGLELRAATLRMAIFSSATVVASVARWLQDLQLQPCTGTDPAQPERLLRDLAIYHAMRGETFAGQSAETISNVQMAAMVWGCAYTGP